nr:MAG TPA: hypothetical protein [Caudoviricetes sp.]
MGSPLFKPGGQIVKAFDSMGSLEKWALPTRLSLTVGRDGHQVGNGTVNGMDSYGRIQIVKSPPGLDFKPVRTSTEPYGCIFKGGGDEGSRTPVRKHCHANFSERRLHILFRSPFACRRAKERAISMSFPVSLRELAGRYPASVVYSSSAGMKRKDVSNLSC